MLIYNIRIWFDIDWISVSGFGHLNCSELWISGGIIMAMIEDRIGEELMQR